MVRLLAFVLAASVVTPCMAGQLYVVSRANSLVPHAGCVVEYDDGTIQWLHFGAKNFNLDAASGKEVLGEVRRASFPLNHIVGVEVSDMVLKDAVKATEDEFTKDGTYRVGMPGRDDRDCVTFAIALARRCGVKTKDDHPYPDVLWKYVKDNNKTSVVIKNADRERGFVPPWEK